MDYPRAPDSSPEDRGLGVRDCFSIKTAKFLFKYTLLCSQIYDRFIILFIKHNHKVSASFKMDFYSVASSRSFAHGQIS